jgi:hypothetical protein
MDQTGFIKGKKHFTLADPGANFLLFRRTANHPPFDDEIKWNSRVYHK